MDIPNNFKVTNGLRKFYKLCFEALERQENSTVFVTWMMAVCFKESLCQPYFDRRDTVYLARLKELPLEAGFARGAWLNEVRVSEGPYKNLIPKFKYCPRPSSRDDGEFLKQPKLLSDHLLRECRWGVAQIHGSRFLEGSTGDMARRRHALFVADPESQLFTLVAELFFNLQNADGNVELMFALQRAATDHLPYQQHAAICMDLAHGFGRALSNEGLPLRLPLSRLKRSV